MTRSSSAFAAAAEQLAEALGPRLLVDEPLGARTTFRVGGNARLFVDAATRVDLECTAAVARRFGLETLVVGRGSNMLVSDDGFDGVAISIANLAADIQIDPDTSTAVVGGGVELPRAARQLAAAGLTGFEWAVGVPGSIGGAVRMNAGGHGSDMASTLISADVLSWAEVGEVGEVGVSGVGGASDDAVVSVRTLAPSELGLAFRSSALDNNHVVLSARLGLAPGDPEQAKRRIAEIVRWRREHQPGGQNCGSVFVNPVPGALPAARLVERSGLRGRRIGTAEVSPKHANFIQADPGGSANDVRLVIDTVRAEVAAATGIVLRSEVRLVGFTDADSVWRTQPVDPPDTAEVTPC